jgi:hypothetical protein
MSRAAAQAGEFTADEMMTACAARALRDGMTCFVGIGLPSAAANLARATHAPGLVLIYESGTIGAKPGWLPLSIGDGVLAETADAVVSVPEIFNYWLQPGRTSASSARPSWTDSAISTPRSSAAPTRTRRSGCPAPGEPRRSPPSAVRSSSSCGRAAGPSWSGWTS